MKKYLLLILLISLIPMTSYSITLNMPNMSGSYVIQDGRDKRIAYVIGDITSKIVWTSDGSRHPDIVSVRLMPLLTDGTRSRFSFGPFHNENCEVFFYFDGWNKPAFQTVGDC